MTNSALAALEVLIGEWDIELTNAEWLDDGKSLNGHMSVEWFDGAFIVMRTEFEEGPPKAVAVIGRNESRPDYQVVYYDDRDVSRTYDMTFDGNVWTQLREDADFYQRFHGERSGDTIEARWEMSQDEGTTWHHDFDLRYTKVAGGGRATG